MLDSVRLGIGVVTFNRKSHVLRTLEKVVAHTKCEYELVIVDDGSTDGSVDALAGQGYTIVTGANMGVCWNKNRALYHLREIAKCNVILLLEDDTFPIKDGWENVWIEAVINLGHVGLAGAWFRERFTSGGGVAGNPYKSPVVSGQCTGFGENCLLEVGYFDTRFKGYGVGHAEHSVRCIRAGYGGEMHRFNDTESYVFYLINSDLQVTDPGGNRSPDQVARNQLVLHSIIKEEVYRDYWRDGLQDFSFWIDERNWRIFTAWINTGHSWMRQKDVLQIQRRSVGS
jgi:glycosyltransferase involved in cell wall biosynthesis